MDKYIIVFCEGDHDIAFLSRILLVEGFRPYNEKVKNFISPLNNLYITALKNKRIEDTEFKFQRADIKVPYAVYEKDNKLVIFHNLGGDGNIKANSNKIKDSYLELNDELLRKTEEYDILNYTFLYFLDADDVGVEERLTEMRGLLELDDELKHYELSKKDDYEVACCIFYDVRCPNTHGKLENILLDLMGSENEKIFQNSEQFVIENTLPDDRQRKFLCNNIEEKSDGSKQFKKEKSIISVAGQLQFSGSTNSVIIAHSDYIKKNDIQHNTICNNIKKMFN